MSDTPIPPAPTVRELLAKALKDGGFDGLFNEDGGIDGYGCGCSADDPYPCGEICTGCVPAYEVPGHLEIEGSRAMFFIDANAPREPGIADPKQAIIAHRARIASEAREEEDHA